MLDFFLWYGDNVWPGFGHMGECCFAFTELYKYFLEDHLIDLKCRLMFILKVEQNCVMLGNYF